GDGGGDAKVVGHGGPSPHADVERHVEVDPDQHAFAVDIGKILEEREPAQRVHCGQRPTRTLRSTSRFEYPHSLSYQPKVLTRDRSSLIGMIMVSSLSKVHDAGDPTMSLET